MIRNPRIVILLAVCLAAFGGLRPSAKNPKIRKILIVGTDNAPPYYSQNADGVIVGVAVDVLRRASAHLDFDLKFVHLAGAPDLFLRSHQADIWPALTITDQREREFHMTEPWLYNTFCLLHLSGKPVPSGPSLRLAHWQNPVNARNAKTFFPGSRRTSRVSREDVMRSVCSGEADAGLIETRVLDSLLLARPSGCEEANLARQSVPGAAFPMGIAAAKSFTSEADELHQQITKMANTGELGKIFESWASITANEANSIVAMNAARQRSHLAYGGGVVILIASAVVFWHSRRVRRAFGLARREVTERKRAEEAHRKADRIRDMVMEGAGEGICGVDAQGRTTFLNSTAVHLLGIELGSSEGRDFHLLVHGLDLGSCVGLSCPLYTGLERLTEVRVDTGRFRRQDGSDFPVEFICSPLFDDGVYAGSVVSFSDITARRQAEMLDRDRNAVLEMLAENKSLDQVFEAIARLVEQQYTRFFCAISAVSNDHLALRAAPSLPGVLREIVRTTEIGASSRSCGTAAYWSKPVYARDLSEDASWTPYCEETTAAGVWCCWSYPILSASNAVLGTVALYGPAPANPDFGQQVLLQVACRLASLAIEHTRLNQQLHHQAHHDSLTGLPNRLLFEERLHQALTSARQNRTTSVLYYIDLDRFKQINDTLSHRVGDLYLCQVSERLQNVLPTSATLARLGGDEFAVVIPFVRDSKEIEDIARDLLQAMSQPFLLDGYTLFGTASIGISLSTSHGSAAELQSCADQAMYRSKSLGRNRFQFYSSDMSKCAIEQLEMEHYLREALETKQFVLHYQPQCHADGALVGLEALLRLRHPERGLIPPGEFIPIAEDTGLILPIGAWVLREACRQLAIWRADGFESLTVAINVSAAQISQGDFADEVSAVLREYDLPPVALEIELTESMIMGNFDKSLAQISRLRDLGVKLSIDDFGTGYSSLSHLHRLPVHTIKIDQSFVRAMDAEVSTKPLVEAIVAAARSLHCSVIAEGVETEAQRRDLVRMGCDRMQGFLFSRPLPASEVLQQFQSLPMAS